MQGSSARGAGQKSGVIPNLGALEDFYAAAQTPVPRLEALDGADVPEPYRSLLVHDGDMTPALESFHLGSIHLQVLRSRRSGDLYTREVVLRMDGSGKAVEFGAIEIDLSTVTTDAREAILEGRRPLGAILRDFSTAHESRPKAFFTLQSDAVINRSLELSGACVLYGRRNTLSVPGGRTLAEIVEILPV